MTGIYLVLGLLSFTKLAEANGLQAYGYYGDGDCYALRMLDFRTDAVLEREVARNFDVRGPVSSELCPQEIRRAATAARVLYPLIGAIGSWWVPGILLAVALAAGLIVALVPVWMLLQRGLLGPAWVVGLLLATSSILRTWGTATNADVLLVSFLAVGLLFLPLDGRLRPRQIVAVLVLCMATSLTKQSWPLWFGLLGLPALASTFKVRRSGRERCLWRAIQEPWVRLFTIAASFLVLMHVGMRLAFPPQNGAARAQLTVDAAQVAFNGDFRAALDYLIQTWGPALKATIGDSAITALRDGSLLVLLVIAALGFVFLWSKDRGLAPEVLVFAGTFLAAMAMTFTNGVIGDFRLNLAVVPSAGLLAGLVIAAWTGSAARSPNQTRVPAR